ncbi:MAG: alpha-L-arabinofuranosidase C-terminal domain-containing protein [Paludibacter sp.]|nr:alpha-L-arabinofuranosidase C-terminal domain-containing protein [Paludibacter sp.]
MKNQRSLHRFLVLSLLSVFTIGTYASDELVRINLNKSKKVSPVQYGFHYEEIGMLGEGGLHAELIRNRGFEEANMPRGLAVKDGLYNAVNPTGNNKQVYHVSPLIGWTTTPVAYSSVKIERTKRNPLNDRNPHSMLVNITDDFVPGSNNAAIHNSGFYGMNFVNGSEYKLSFYVRSNGYKGNLAFQLSDDNGRRISDPKEFRVEGDEWVKYTATLKATSSCERGMLSIVPAHSGRFQLDMVSMFPADTWDNGKSIFRKDIMQNLVDYRLDFLRFPGGCIVHGVNEETMYQWKETIGDIAQRPGAWSKWAPYYRTDGLGYHEFYELCEYLNADAMYVTPTGMVCTEWVEQTGVRQFKHIHTDIDYYVQDALDAIEYAIGPVDSKWGAERAKNGHPAPFPLKYVEIGNEDFGPEYYPRYEKIATTIKNKYPHLKIIANSIIFREENDKQKYIKDFIDPSKIDIYDEHYYQTIDWVKEEHYRFDAYKRNGPDIFIGELGIGGRYPKGILAEGVVKLSLERNGELNPLMADRPLMRNFDFLEGRRMNPVLLHNTSKSIKTFNYYMCEMLRDNTIDVNYNVEVTNQKDVFVTAGRDSKTKEYIVKVINLADETKEVKIEMAGLKKNNDVIITELTAIDGQINTPLSPENVKPKIEQRKISFPVTEKLLPNSFRVYRIK